MTWISDKNNGLPKNPRARKRIATDLEFAELERASLLRQIGRVHAEVNNFRLQWIILALSKPTSCSEFLTPTHCSNVLFFENTEKRLQFHEHDVRPRLAQFVIATDPLT